MIQNKLIGTGVALVTPFLENGKIDFKALEKIIKIHLEYTDYIVLLGTTAESATINLLEKKEIIEFTKSIVQKKIPIVVGMGGNNTQHIIEEINSLPLNDISAILSVSPYYNKPSQEGLYQHYKKISEHISLPIILYNVPGRTAKNISAETTIRLSQDCQNIIGIKEASGDIEQAMQILKATSKDFIVISGDDTLTIPLIACGAKGVISVIANSFPEPFSKMVKFALNGQFAEAVQINNQFLEIYKLLFEENNPAGVKAFMFEKKWIQNYLRLPLVPVSTQLHQKIKENLLTSNF